MPKVFNTDQIESILTRVRDSIGGRPIITLSHIKDGTIHQLNGLDGLTGLVPALFIATDNFVNGDTFTVDGVEYNAQMSDGEPVPNNVFTTASTMVIVLNTIEKKITFKSSDVESGGLGDDQLALATATTDQVFLGQTFYAGNDELKTGTFDLAAANATAAQVLSGYKFYAGDSTLKTGTLTGGPNIKSGYISPVDWDTVKSVNVGFKPVLVCVWAERKSDWINAWCYNNNAYLTGSGNVNEMVEVGNRITITENGFDLDNEVYTGYYGDFYPFDIGEDIYYVAIG